MLQITNKNFFESTKALEFGWVLSGDGDSFGSGILPAPVIEPQGSYAVEWESCPWFSIWESSLAREGFLTIISKLMYSTRWASAGHVVASTQLCLPERGECTFKVSFYIFFEKITLIIDFFS